MKKLKTEKGITLIALVITIIVMLILVGVSVTVALNGGLFSTAQQATNKTQLELDKEQLLMATIGALDDNGKIDTTKLELPEGFTESEGVYTSKAGNKFTISEYGSVTVAGGNEGGEGEEPVALAAGLYDANNDLIASWDELVNTYGLDITSSEGAIMMGSGATNSVEKILENNTELSNGVKLIIADGVTTIGQNQFIGCALTEVVMPDSVTSIGGGVFAYSDITSITLSNNLTSLSMGAFYYCEGLTSIRIPNSVTEIYSGSTDPFDGCTNLTTIYYSGTAEGRPWGATNATVLPNS